MHFADNDVGRVVRTDFFGKGVRMGSLLVTAAGSIAACFLLFGGMSALSQETAPTAAGMEVASSAPVAGTEEHPLMPVIRWAERERPNIAAIQDYTAIVQKQENINGVVQGAQVMEVKIRHEPFSVYIRFRYPRNLSGQQAIFVRGQNNDRLVAHGVGLQRNFGTQKLDPEGFLAMQGNKYPITDIGILNLVDKLLEVGYRDIQFGECEVTYTENVKVGDRYCTMIQVVHPVPRRNFIFHIARIFVDNELNMPIRYESYDWPRRPGEVPQLIEAYIYSNLRLNVGLTDADFDYKNPAYNFP